MIQLQAYEKMRPSLLFIVVFLLNLGIIVKGQYNTAFQTVNGVPVASQYPQQAQGFASQPQETWATTESHDHIWMKPEEEFKETELSDKEDLEPMEKDKFKDLDEFENGKKNDTKHEKDEDIDDEASGDHQSADEAFEKKHDRKKEDGQEKQDDRRRINKRFIPLMRIPLYLNKPFYPWMKQSYCFHPVCHVPGMRNGFKGWQKRFLAAYVVIHDIMYLAYRC